MRIRHAGSLTSGRFIRGANDPHWQFVKLLVGFNGTPGDNVFIDESPVQHTLTTVGAMDIDAEAKIGFGQSGAVNTGEINVNDPRDIFMGAAGDADFTLEFFARRNAAGANQGLVSRAGTGSTQHWGVRLNSSTIPTFTGGSVPAAVGATTVIAIDTWYFISAGRFTDGGTATTWIAVNGTIEGTITTTWTAVTGNQDGVIGDMSGFSPFAGFLDEVRLTIGVDRYQAANHAVPTQPFPRS